MAPLVLTALVLSGCTMAGKSHHTPGPAYVYNAPDSGTIERRAGELQSRGHSKEAALARAKLEAEHQAWQGTSTGISEQARLAALQEQDRFNAGLHKVMSERNAP